MVLNNQYQIKMENFEGPLDLLCHLVEKNKMNICDIRINDITNQYLDYLQAMQEMNLEVTSEFITMASRLIYLKSKTLLPSLVEDDKEEEIDLVQMLLEYKRYKEISKLLREEMIEFGGKIYKMPEKIDLPKNKLELTYDKEIIPNTYMSFLSREKEKKNVNADNVKKLAVEEKVTIISKIKDILKQLIKKPSFVFNKIFNLQSKSKVEVTTAFLSMLELSRKNKITISQSKLFGDINITKIKRKHNEIIN